MTEMKAITNTFYDLETVIDDEELEEEQEDMLEMWLEKLNRPGRLQERGGKEVTKEDLLKMMAEDREQAMVEIMAMNAREFQTRLFDGTLPDFVRDNNPPRLSRDTCHSMQMLTEREFELKCISYGDYHRDKLRYMSVEAFIDMAYTR
jgi:hypothetical protein